MFNNKIFFERESIRLEEEERVFVLTQWSYREYITLYVYIVMPYRLS